MFRGPDIIPCTLFCTLSIEIISCGVGGRGCVIDAAFKDIAKNIATFLSSSNQSNVVVTVDISEADVNP